MGCTLRVTNTVDGLYCLKKDRTGINSYLSKHSNGGHCSCLLIFFLLNTIFNSFLEKDTILFFFFKIDFIIIGIIIIIIRKKKMRRGGRRRGKRDGQDNPSTKIQKEMFNNDIIYTVCM